MVGVEKKAFCFKKKKSLCELQTRPKPSFLHHCNNYDSSILAIFSQNPDADVEILKDLLN